MPRRRNPFNPRNPRRPRPNPFAGHAAPPPVVAATPTIDLPRLQLAYEWMTLDRLLGFKLVFEWYVANQVALLWQDPLGVQMAVFALVMQIVGAICIKKIVDIKV